MLSILFGLMAMALGGYGTWKWHGEFLFFFRGMLPVSLFFAGLIAVLTGFASQKTGMNDGKERHEKG